jgi:hypothetical protein
VNEKGQAMRVPRALHHKTARLATLLVALLATGTTASLAQGGLASSGTTVLRATLTGRYLHTTSPGSGTATITITASKVCWKFSYRGLDTPNDSGIHVAPPPRAGVHKTSVFPFTATTSQAHQCVSPTKWGPNGPSWLTKIAANPGRFYVIVATTKYPQGAIGGALRRG